MTTEKGLVELENKFFECDYIYCDQCALNGIPNQRIALVYLGIRPVNEPGFIYIFKIYDYPIGTKKRLHSHKYDNEIIGRLVDDMLSQTRGCSQ